MSLRTQFLALLILLLLLVTTNTVLVMLLDKEGRQKHEAVDHTHEIIDESEKLFTQIVHAETGQRGYLLTQNTSYLTPYYDGIKKAKTHFLTLTKITIHQREQQEKLSQLDVLINKKFDELDLTINLVMQNSPSAIQAAMEVVQSNEGKEYMEQIRKLISEFQNIQREKLDIEMSDFQQHSLLLTYLISIQIPLLILLCVFSAVFINKKLFIPLKQLLHITEQLEKGDKPNVSIVYRHDEIGHLLKRFQRMSNIIHKRTKRLNFQAKHDHLTGALNRSDLEPHLRQAINTCSVDNKLALIFIDINKFKQLNDNYGHSIGDKVLIETAKRISSTFRADDAIYRYGGDEFIIIVENISKIEYIEPMLNHLLKSFEVCFEIEQHTFDIDLSIGVALAPDHSDDWKTLINLADKAMYSAKLSHNASYCIHGQA